MVRNGALTDSFGRTARKLRISVTDRCNLRCRYCMPEKPQWLPKKELLSYEELALLVRAAVSCGIETVRLTGGEPLLRKDLPDFAAMLRRIPGLRRLVLTTNGTLLAASARALRAAGLDGVTISLDSLDPSRSRAMARADALEPTLKGIEAAREAGFSKDSLKVNAVIMRGVNDEEILRLASWGRENGLTVRFIEFMPLEGDGIWSPRTLVPAEEIVERILAVYPALARPRKSSATAEEYDYADGKGSFAVIASVTRAFCGDCDRIRITADGGLRTCLFARSATDLRGPLRSGADLSELAALMREAVSSKERGHMISSPSFSRPERAMNAIGG